MRHFPSDGQSSLKQSFFFSSSLTRPYDATILPARALRLMDRPMHLWQSVHIDHHHCLHMEGRGAWGGGSDRAACRCRTCCVLKLLKGRIQECTTTYTSMLLSKDGDLSFHMIGSTRRAIRSSIELQTSTGCC